MGDLAPGKEENDSNQALWGKFLEAYNKLQESNQLSVYASAPIKGAPVPSEALTLAKKVATNSNGPTLSDVGTANDEGWGDDNKPGAITQPEAANQPETVNPSDGESSD